MKNFTIFLFAALLGVSAQAKAVDQSARHLMSIKRDSENAQLLADDARARILNSQITLSANRSEGLSPEGEWKFRLFDPWYEIEVDAVYYGMLVGNTLLLENLNNNGPDAGERYYPVVCEFDDASNKFTIKRRLVGRDWRGRYVFLQPFVPTGKGGVREGEIEGYYVPETGELKFDYDDSFYLTYIDYDNMEGNGQSYDPGYWYMPLSAKRSGDLDKENPDNWISLGEATLIDGWLSPIFGYDQNREENRLHPELVQYKKNNKIYRLVNPFNEGRLADLNESTKDGYIEFDVTDPNHVLLNRIDCGWICRDAGINKFYCYNMLGYFIEDYRLRGKNYTVGEFLWEFDNPDIPYTTFKDGVVDFGAMLYGGELVYDANFGDVNYPGGGNVWINHNMRSRIYFPNTEVTEPEISFVGEPSVDVNFDTNSAEITVEFDYRNKPDNATIFAMVTDKKTGRWVARKFINLNKYGNDYSFVLDGLTKDVEYDYLLTVRIEGGLSEVLATSDPVSLNFSTDPQDIRFSGVDGIDNDTSTPVYFNLQGIRIESPRIGETYIKVVRNKATKVIY